MMPTNNTSGEISIFFAKAPDLGHLCTIACRVSDSDGDEASSNLGTQTSSSSHSQQQNRGNQSTVLKCRQLIFTEPRVLASPSLPDGGYISVVCSRAFWMTGKLQERCQKMSLQYGEPKKVYAAVFQVCFCYTLKAKLAPLWNKVGEYYVQGRDFITSTGLLGAVNLDINISEGEISFAVKPQTIKLPHCTLQEFGISCQNITHFLCDTSSVISEYFIEDRFCFVLPSMKKGRVVSLMHNLPASSPFKTYSDLRRYWKNTYGYRLPESGEGLVYLEIFFPAIRNTLFTYPEFCIRKKEPQRIPRVDPAPILAAFLADVRRKFPSMCDSPVELTSKAMYTAVTMRSVIIEETSPSSACSVNLVSQPSPQTRRIPTRSLVSVADCYKKYPDCPLPSHQPPPYHSLSGQQKSILPTTGYIIKTPQLDQQDHTTLPHARPHHSCVQKRVASSHLQGQSHGRPNYIPACTAATGEDFHGHSSTPHDPSIMLNPVGTQSSVVHGNLETFSMTVCGASHDFPLPTTAAVSKMAKSLPDGGGTGKQQAHTMFSMAAHLQSKSQDAGDVQCSFEPPTCHLGQPRFSVLGVGQPSNHSQGQLPVGSQRQRNHISDVSENIARKPPPFVPIFKPKPTLSHVTNEYKAPAGPKIKPTFTARKPKPVTLSTAQHKAVAPHPSASVHPTPASPQPSEDVIPPTQPQGFNHTSGRIQLAQSTSAFSVVGQGKSKQFIRGPSVQQPVKVLSNSLSNETPARKRKIQEPSEAGKTKKPKVHSKPKVQDHSMVHILAQNDQLSKVNSVTLASWLKEKGVPVSSKDKKSDLVAKVMTYITCTTTES